MAEVVLDVKTDIAKILAKHPLLSPDTYPAVAAHGMNKTMVTIRAREKRAMSEQFDRPTPYTLGGFYTVPALNKRGQMRLQVEIRLKDTPEKGTPAAKYLAPEVYSGARGVKRFESLLRSRGILPAGLFCVPAKGFDNMLDKYGNIPRSFLTKVLSDLQAFPEGGFKANRVEGKPAKFFYINHKDRRNLPLGIYTKFSNGSSRMAIAFVKQPQYQKRYTFFEVAQKTTAEFLEKDVIAAAKEAQNKAFSGIQRTLFESLKGGI